jgi:Domain of unknown function (DUF4837)
MKKHYLLLILFSFCLFSCVDSTENTIPKTSGKTNSISILIDDQLWVGEIGDTIRNKFAAPVEGLQQEEPLFTINQYPVKLLEGYSTNSRNIIIIKKESKSRFEINKNEFAEPQNVVHISGKSAIEILDTIQKNAPLIIQKIQNTEIQELQKTFDKSISDSKKITKKFNISLDIPKSYKFVLQKPRFLWLKKEITSGSTSLMIYEVPTNSVRRDKNALKSISRMRDSIGNLYIHGAVRYSRMISQPSFVPILNRTLLIEKDLWQTRGVWEMENDFMSGPFVNYCIFDRAKERIIVLEGFCYAPSKEKRDLMFELECIMKSIEFIKPKTKNK